MFRDDLVRLRNNEEKAAYLQRKAVEDTKSPRVQEWAKQFSGIADEMQRARAILRFVTLAVDYVRDPGVEVLDGAGVVCVRGYGDCDAKMRLFVALCLLCGISARAFPVFVGPRFPHVRAEVFVGGRWLPVDPIIVNSDVGVLPSHPKTSWRGGGRRVA